MKLQSVKSLMSKNLAKVKFTGKAKETLRVRAVFFWQSGLCWVKIWKKVMKMWTKESSEIVRRLQVNE